MLPLIGIVAQLFPEIVKQLGAPLHEQSGSVQDQVLDAIKKVVTIPDPKTADPQAVRTAIENSPPAKEQLQNDLQQIALEELKERDRAKEEAQRIEFERYRMDAEERERIRAEEFQRQLLDFQDRQVARSSQMTLAEEHNPLAWVAPILAFLLVAMIWYLLHGIMTAREVVINKDVFNVVLGALVTAFTTVVAFYFGSSLSSSKKDAAIQSGRLTTNTKSHPASRSRPGRRCRPGRPEAPAAADACLGPRDRPMTAPRRGGRLVRLRPGPTDYSVKKRPSSCAVSCTTSAYPRFRRRPCSATSAGNAGGSRLFKK